MPNHIYRVRALKQPLIEGLRQERKYRRAQKAGQYEETRGKISGMLSIEERPAEVEDRSVPGHWEGDLLYWASTNAVHLALWWKEQHDTPY